MVEPDTTDVSRRTILGATGGSLSGVVWGKDASIGGVGERAEQLSPTPGTATPTPDGPPAFPDRPFIVAQFGAQLLASDGQGWGGWNGAASLAEALPTLLRFHPDVFDFTVLFPYVRGVLQSNSFQDRGTEAATLTGIPSTSGWNPTLAIDEQEATARYGPAREEYGWTYPDGDTVEHTHGLLAETVEGAHHRIAYAPGGFGIPSVFAPGTLDLITNATRTRYGQGFSGFELDGVDVFNLRGLDLSVWARAAFRDHLESLPASRQRDLGITDPASFDFLSYLEENDRMPGSGNDPREDPVFREFVRHHHRGVNALFADIRADSREEFPRRVEDDRAAFWGNQYTGSLHNPQQANVYASDYFDVINTEFSPSDWGPSDAAYKYLRAVGRFEKPVMAKGTLTSVAGLRDVGSLDPERRYPMFNRLQAAEAYANGAIFKIPLTSRLPANQTVNHWIRTDGTMEPELQSFIDFLWAHGRFFADLESDNPVAVVWSLPSRIWRRLPQWNIPPDPWNGPGVNSFLGTTAILRQNQVPYDVLVFGHSALWDDAEQRDRLQRYAAVVLPNLLCINDSQLSALERYLENAGTVLVSGSPPRRSETYRPRDDVEAILDHENVTVLDGDPGRTFETQGQTSGSLLEALEATGIEPSISADVPTVAVNRFHQAEPRRQLVHLLNYDYDPESDDLAVKRTLGVRLPATGLDDPVARYYSPQRIVDLPVSERENAVEVEVPELVEWGFVAVADSREALEPSTSEQEATEELERARQTLDAAREAGAEGTPRYVIASSRLAAAETALSYDAYGAARDTARKAVRQAAEAQRTSDRFWSRTPGFDHLLAVFGVVAAIAYALIRRGRDSS